MDNTLFKDTYNKALEVLKSGKPIFITVDDSQEIMIKKGAMNSMEFTVSYICNGRLLREKQLEYNELVKLISESDPFKFRSEYVDKGDVIKVDFNKKRIL